MRTGQRNWAWMQHRHCSCCSNVLGHVENAMQNLYVTNNFGKKEVHHRIRIEVKGVACLRKNSLLQSHRIREFGSTLDHDGVSHFITYQSIYPVELNMSITT